jgi:hypothetical protein
MGRAFEFRKGRKIDVGRQWPKHLLDIVMAVKKAVQILKPILD